MLVKAHAYSRQNHRTLAQLPELGANTKPRALRKDLWHPLFTVCMPTTEGATVKGVQLYKNLCRNKILRERTQPPSILLSRPYSEQEREKLKKRLDERGGSKLETVYDIIKREKKKLRLRQVMDHKANSIADLAALLTVDNARVEWKNVLDAEHAEVWWREVEHHRMEFDRHESHKPPAPQELKEITAVLQNRQSKEEWRQDKEKAALKTIRGQLVDQVLSQFRRKQEDLRKKKMAVRPLRRTQRIRRRERPTRPQTEGVKRLSFT
jgi:hypothetical protein